MKKIGLSSISFKGKVKLHNLILKDGIKNREIVRIIKNIYESQNNIIEVNKFYALEMKEREKELNPFKEPFEWLVFKIHGLASNHSQDWILSLF